MILIKEIQFIKADGGKYLLLNLINGAADLISPQIYRQLSENRLADLEAAVVETMKKRRYLFENESEYQDFLQKLDAKLEGLEKSSVPSFLIIPSYSCNLNAPIVTKGPMTFSIRRFRAEKTASTGSLK